MHIAQTPEQLLLRNQAARENPEFATLEGRALEDVRETISYLAVGLRPETVLGGLMLSQFGLFDSTLVPGNDRGAIEIAAKGGVAPIGPNDRGDTVDDILEGLVRLGFVERVFTPNTPEALLLPDDDFRRVRGRPTYRLSTESLPQEVKQVVERVVTRKTDIDDYTARRSERKSKPRRKLFGKK